MVEKTCAYNFNVLILFALLFVFVLALTVFTVILVGHFL